MLWAFLAALAFFHSSEFVLQWIYNPDDLSARSLLFSTEYMAAMLAALAEYSAEWLLFPSIKAALRPVQVLGAAMVVSGELLRKAAIVTAGPSFIHDIKTDKRACHKLITRGVYRFMRHPSYAGWMLWSIGTQLLLANPVCAVSFAIVSWRFMARRIPYEEFFLHQFFGLEYAQYACTVPTGIPFVQ